jgi:multiple sugar transport system substrate-binding protein
VLGVATVAGCRGDATHATVVEFWAMGREGEVVQRLVPEFERRTPGVRVRVQQIPWSAAHEKLLTAYVGGALPDVVQVGNTWLPELVALGALAPLDDRLAPLDDRLAPLDDQLAPADDQLAPVDDQLAPLDERSLDPADEFPGVVAATAIDGVRYGVPWYVDTRVLFYRTDLLRAAGVATPPTTWSGWVDAMARIARGDQRYAISLPATEWEPPVILALQRGAGLLRDGDRYGDFRSPAFRAAFEFYRDFFRRGLAPTGGAAQSANLYQDFADGYFAVLLSGPWNVGEIERRLPKLADAWATAPLPAFEGEAPGLSLAGGASLALVRDSPRREAAWQWIAFLAEPAQQLEFWRLTGDLPARPSAWRDGGLRDAPRTAAFWRQLARVQATPKIPEWERIAATITRHTEIALRSDAPADDVLAALDRDVDAILEKRRWMLERAAARRAAAFERDAS